jgi:hypothetical protein
MYNFTPVHILQRIKINVLKRIIYGVFLIVFLFTFSSITFAAKGGNKGNGNDDAPSEIYDLLIPTLDLGGSEQDDTTAPSLTSTIPLDNAIDVSVSSGITLTFSEAIDEIKNKSIQIKLASDDSLIEEIKGKNSKVTGEGTYQSRYYFRLRYRILCSNR